MKLLYGESKFIPLTIHTPTRILNFSSMNERYCPLSLIPPNNLGAFNEVDFDMKYANWLLSNEQQFFNVMAIVRDVYDNMGDIFLLVTEDPWLDAVNESFMKFLQVRYGIVGTCIKCAEDYEYAGETEISVSCLPMFDQDILRYNDLVERKRIMEGGTPILDE